MAYIPSTIKGLNVICTECKKTFKLNKPDLSIHKAKIDELREAGCRIEKGIKYYKIHYFCPECKKEYIVGFIDNVMRTKLGNDIKRADFSGNVKLSKSLRKVYQARMNKINNK